MEQAFSIWSPVLIAKLEAPCRSGHERVYETGRLYRMLDDLKIKVKQTEVIPQGQVAEVRFRIELLCLLEDTAGHMQLLKKEETIRERVAYADFDHEVGRADALNFVIDLRDISLEGELDRGQLRVRFLLEFTLLATREQLVKLWAEERGEIEQRQSLDHLFERLEAEVNRLTGENQELHRKVFFYQRDVTSLKRSVGKLEKRNAGLLRELGLYQQESEDLHRVLREKEERINRLKSRLSYQVPGRREFLPAPESGEPGLGYRIKQLFLNNQNASD